MRAVNYRNTREAYTPWGHTDMVRAALVEGLVPYFTSNLKPDEVERRKKESQRYRRLLVAYTEDGLNERIDRAFDILQQKQLTPRQKRFMAALTHDLGRANAWKRMDHSHLEREGVIIRYKGSLSGLVDLLYHTTEENVVVVDDFPIPSDKDYVKHVPQRHKLLLNGKEVIRHFAESEGIELPGNYLGSGRLTGEVRKILETANFTFNAAFEHAVYVMEESPGRFISMFVIRNSDGNELRMFPYELIAGTELFYEIASSRGGLREISMRHGDIGGEFKYHGANIFNAPKRRPFGPREKDTEGRSKTHNEVEVHHMPHIERPREMALEWMDTRVSCNCDSALNLRNFEERRGNTVRIVNHFDAHARVVLLYVADQEGITAKNDEHGLLLYPTEGYVRLVDRFRYNLSDGSSSVGTRNICFLANEALKLDRPYSSKFSTEQPEKDDILKPRMLVRIRKKLKKT